MTREKPKKLMKIQRRKFIQAGGALSLMLTGRGVFSAGNNNNRVKDILKKAIPSSGEKLSVVGMGTSRTFTDPEDVGYQQKLLEVMNTFFDNGGQLLDSSPMYGAAETIIGRLLPKTDNTQNLFAATKVWTHGEREGIEQMQASMLKMGVKVMDLMQIHNLKDWKTQLKTLRHWKEEGRIRYIGITTSHGRSHSDFLDIMRTEPLDFVQFSYNIEDRTAENRLLPMAKDKGIATLINRPFQRGSLFAKSKGKALPDFVSGMGCESWGQYFLKFILAHPAATCVIPASSKAHHMQDNMGAGFGRLPTVDESKEMLSYYNKLQ